MAVYYLEIVSDDVDMLVGLYQHVHGLSFGRPGSRSGAGPRRELGQTEPWSASGNRWLRMSSRSCVRTSGSKTSNRPRRKAEESGATIAYPSTRPGDHATFAMAGGVQQHGFHESPLVGKKAAQLRSRAGRLAGPLCALTRQ
jgi:hypothetical protein